MQDGANGFVIANGDTSVVRQRLELLMRDHELLERMKSNGLTTAKRFSWQSTVDRVEDWLQSSLEESPLGSWEQLLALNPRAASFEICSRAFEQAYPKSVASFRFENLDAEFQDTDIFYAVILGWSWPASVARVHIESASLLDLKIKPQLRLDVAASGCCPAGASPGFRAELLFTGRRDSLLDIQENIVYELKDGTHVRPGAGSLNGTAFLDSCNLWRCWHMQLGSKAAPPPTSTFRLSFGGKRKAVALAPARPEVLIDDLSWLQDAVVSGSNFVADSDHFLLYHLSENPSSSLYLFSHELVQPELVCARLERN